MRRQLLLLTALVTSVALAVATTVLAVLWAGDGEDREIADQVRANRAVWDARLADLRTFEDSVGPLWTTGSLRVAAYGEVAVTRHTGVRSGEPVPDVYTLPDGKREACRPGVGEAGERTVLQVCRESSRGEMAAAEDLPADQMDDTATITVTEWRTMPGATDARVFVDVEAPVVTGPGEAALRAQLERAMDLAEPWFAAIAIQQLDLDSPTWTDYDFQLDAAVWGTQPAPVISDE